MAGFEVSIHMGVSELHLVTNSMCQRAMRSIWETQNHGGALLIKSRRFHIKAEEKFNVLSCRDMWSQP